LYLDSKLNSATFIIKLRRHLPDQALETADRFRGRCPHPIPASDAVATARRNSPGPKTGEVRSAVYVSNAEPLVTTSLHSNSPVVVVNCIPVTAPKDSARR
jgi:hypothetical protein